MAAGLLDSQQLIVSILMKLAFCFLRVRPCCLWTVHPPGRCQAANAATSRGGGPRRVGWCLILQRCAHLIAAYAGNNVEAKMGRQAWGGLAHSCLWGGQRGAVPAATPGGGAGSGQGLGAEGGGGAERSGLEISNGTSGIENAGGARHLGRDGPWAELARAALRPSIDSPAALA